MSKTTKKTTAVESVGPVSESEQTKPISPNVDIAAIVKAAIEASRTNNEDIAEAITKGITANQRPRIGPGHPQWKVTTPFNPAGKSRTLKREYTQNGAPLRERNLSDQEIEMLEKLTPGVYGPPDFPIAVVEQKNLEGTSRIHVLYPDGNSQGKRNPDNQNRQKNYAPNFYLFLARLVQEAKDQKLRKREEARALLADDPTE